MRECLRCGKPLPPRVEKGHRERNYCSDRCRQRACRERNRQKHNLDRIIKEANERIWNAIEQQVHRETWQDELEYYHRVRDHMLKELAFMEERQRSLQQHIEFLDNSLAEKEAEIVRLTTLLESQAKRKHR